MARCVCPDKSLVGDTFSHFGDTFSHFVSPAFLMYGWHFVDTLVTLFSHFGDTLVELCWHLVTLWWHFFHTLVTLWWVTLFLWRRNPSKVEVPWWPLSFWHNSAKVKISFLQNISKYLFLKIFQNIFSSKYLFFKIFQNIFSLKYFKISFPKNMKNFKTIQQDTVVHQSCIPHNCHLRHLQCNVI